LVVRRFAGVEFDQCPSRPGWPFSADGICNRQETLGSILLAVIQLLRDFRFRDLEGRKLLSNPIGQSLS
jgi:hypothetical protein